MNLLLLEPHELDAEGRAAIGGPRARHIESVLRIESQDSIRAGVVGGKIGLAHLQGVENSQVRLQFEPRNDPPPALPLKLILALPRPKVLKRVLASMTSLGIKDIYLVNAFRVEKPYWSSEQVTLAAIREACLAGLEQARDTILPEVRLEKLFRPFVEDRLKTIAAGTRAFVAHPAAETVAPVALKEPMTLVIGPEGGFIPFEVDLLKSVGCEPVRLSERILKVETAIAYLAGRMTAL